MSETREYIPDDGDGAADEQRASLRWHGDVDPVTTRPWLVKNLIPETGAGLLSGQWGTFKTFAAIDLAVAVMIEGTFIAFPVKRRGGVLFIAAEGQHEVPIRLQAALDAKGGLAKDEHAPFAWCSTCPRLLDKSAGQELAAMAREAADGMRAKFNLPLALIVIDTVGRSADYEKTGDENDAAIGFKIMKVMAALSADSGAFVLGVDHFGKAPETGTRGTSSKEGDADVVLALVGDKTITGTVTNTRLCARKRRSGANGEEFPFRTRTVNMGVDEDGEAITTLTIDWSASEPGKIASKNDGWTKSLRLLRRTLMNVLVDHGSEQRPFPDGPTVRAVDLEIVRAEFYRSYPAEGDDKTKRAARQKAFRRAIDSAHADNLISVREIGATTLVWLARVQDSPAQSAYEKEL